MHHEPLKESLPIKHAMRANMERRDVSHRRKAGRRPFRIWLSYICREPEREREREREKEKEREKEREERELY